MFCIVDNANEPYFRSRKIFIVVPCTCTLGEISANDGETTKLFPLSTNKNMFLEKINNTSYMPSLNRIEPVDFSPILLEVAVPS